MTAKPYSEEELQVNIAAYLRVAMPANVPWTAVEGTRKDRRDGGKQKRKGVNSGWADLQFFPGEFIEIELKRPAVAHIGQRAGTQSPVQKEHQAAIEANGGFYYLAYSGHEVEGILRGHGIALKSRFI